MKRLLAVAVVLGIAFSAVALADDTKKMDGKMDGKTMHGTVTKVDEAGKMMTVKDKSGKEWTIYWNDQTKVEGGAPKEGAMVSFKAENKDGKMWATWVKSGESHHKM
jgi:Cu/Ag efflux protein CusF